MTAGRDRRPDRQAVLLSLGAAIVPMRNNRAQLGDFLRRRREELSPAEEIDAVAATPTNVVEFDSAHSPFLTQPAELAAVIAEVC